MQSLLSLPLIFVLDHQVDQAFKFTSVGPYYVGSSVTDLIDPRTVDAGRNGIVFNVTVGVARNYPDDLQVFVNEFIKSLVFTNYSIGGTDLYVEPTTFNVNLTGVFITFIGDYR